MNLFYTLSVLFKGITIVQIRHIFLHMLTVLSNVLIYVHFPSKEEIQKKIPICFIDFPDVRVIFRLHRNSNSEKEKYLLSNNNIFKL